MTVETLRSLMLLDVQEAVPCLRIARAIYLIKQSAEIQHLPAYEIENQISALLKNVLLPETRNAILGPLAAMIGKMMELCVLTEFFL